MTGKQVARGTGLFCIGLSVLCSGSLVGAQSSAKKSTVADDAAWTKGYATVCDDQPCKASGDARRADRLLSDPRFKPLMKRLLRQDEAWWVDGYGGSEAVSSLAETFLGVPQGVRLDNDRYITTTGCVPHDCTTTGMLWIDTGTHPATLVFVGEDLVVGGKGDSGYQFLFYF